MSEKYCAKSNAKTTSAMRVKATVLSMLDLGETASKSVVCLGIDDSTVYRHLENYQTDGLDKFLGSNYFDYWGKLSSFQIVELRTPVERAALRNLCGDWRVG